MNQPQVILASTSPRRKELLAAMGVSFEVIASNFDEYLDHDRPAADIATELSRGKAMAVAMQHPNAIVIGSDTIPHRNGTQLEKPIDYDDAKATLTVLSGQAHFVTTGLAVICISKQIDFADSVTTNVTFKPFNEAVIDTYLQTGDYKDKAAAYGIQSGAAPLIESYSGDADVIVGLPTRLLAVKLQELGVDCSPVRLDLPVTQI